MTTQDSATTPDQATQKWESGTDPVSRECDLADFVAKKEARFVQWDGAVNLRDMSIALPEQDFRQYLGASRMLRALRRPINP